ncbi:hypothetical protein IJT10_04845 [bacterium]|nr:hypothetical protein [bacterium]
MLLKPLDVLSEIMLLNRDNSKKFTVTDRLDKINTLLWNSRYRRLNAQGLFHLFGVCPIENIDKPIILVSSHVDCEAGIHKCFTREENDDLLFGTYDNCITNAAILYLMLEDKLPNNVLISFTGDEEINDNGAKQTCKYFDTKNRKIFCVAVLDVTYMGWNERADFTVENNFWQRHLGTKVINVAEQTRNKWCFVPEDPDDIPSYVNRENVINTEADCDESWLYNELNKQCFSVCLPVNGPMHSDKGVFARRDSFTNYIESLRLILQNIANL